MRREKRENIYAKESSQNKWSWGGGRSFFSPFFPFPSSLALQGMVPVKKAAEAEIWWYE